MAGKRHLASPASDRAAWRSRASLHAAKPSARLHDSTRSARNGKFAKLAKPGGFNARVVPAGCALWASNSVRFGPILYSDTLFSYPAGIGGSGAYVRLQPDRHLLPACRLAAGDGRVPATGSPPLEFPPHDCIDPACSDDVDFIAGAGACCRSFARRRPRRKFSPEFPSLRRRIQPSASFESK